MNQNKSEIKVPAKFRCLVEGSYRYYVFHGGRGSSKSHTIARYFISMAMAGRFKFLCTRELQNSILESVYSLFKEIISIYKLEPWFKLQNASIECVTGSEFIFKGLAHNINSIKSMEGIDFCWVEEADKVSQNSWDILIPTIRKKGSRLFVTFNPTHEDDPVYQMFVVNRMPDSVVVEVNYNDNRHFPDVLKKEMEHMRATNYEKYLHVWEGKLRTISDAQIFRGKFVVQDFSSDGVQNFRHGMDFGFADDPSTVIRMFIKGKDLYIDQEAFGHHVEIPELSNLIAKVIASRHYKIKADCARPETISFLKGMHWNIEGAKKWAGSVEDGIEYIKSFGRVIIHPRCVHTIEEFKRYSFKVDRHTNEILPIVVDDYNHCIDAIRYALDELIRKKTTIYDDGVI